MYKICASAMPWFLKVAGRSEVSLPLGELKSVDSISCVLDILSVIVNYYRRPHQHKMVSEVKSWKKLSDISFGIIQIYVAGSR